MEEVLSDDIYDVKGSLSRAIDRVKEQIAQLTDVEDKIAYLRDHKKKTHISNVGIIDIIGEGGQYESRRVSVNEGWYSKFYREHKKAPGIRDAYDIAIDEALEEIEHTDDPEAAAAGDEIRALRSKLETLERLEPYVKRMDRDDLITRAQMSEDAYREIYAPALKALSGGNEAVTQAARDSALIYAKMAEALHEAYHIPYANIAKIQTGQQPAGKAAYLQTTPEGRKLDRNELDVTELTGDEFGPYADIKELRKKAVGYYTEQLQGHSARNEILGNILFDKEPDIYFSGSGKREMASTSAREEKLLAVRYLPEIISSANTITESDSEKEKHGKQHFYYLHQAVRINGEVKYVVVTVRSEGREGKTYYYNHNVYTGKEYKKIEDACNLETGDRVSSTDRNPEEASSVSYSIAGGVRIYKSGNIYKQMAGEHAVGAPLAKREEAKSMEADGKNREKIWKKTGWTAGKDGKWRWEVPDNMDGIRLEALKSEDNGLFGPAWETAYLGDIYDNPKLYEAYPWLKYLEVSAGDIGPETHRGYTKMGRRADLDTITLNANIMHDEAQAKETLIHEIQHVIQHYEGFASGGSPESVIELIRRERDGVLGSIHSSADRADYAAAVDAGDERFIQKTGEKLSESERKELREKVARLHELNRQEEDAIGRGAFKAYQDLAGEQEARETSVRAEMINRASEKEKESRKKAIDARRHLEESMKGMDEADREKITELADTEKRIMESGENPGEEVLDRIDELESWMNENAPQAVKDAYEAFGDALWRHVGALDDKKAFERMMPDVHGDNAIVVFGGTSIPYSMTARPVYYQKAWHG